MLAIVTKRKGKGVINSRGKIVLPCKYDDVYIMYPYSDYPFIRFTENGETVYRNFDGIQKSLEELSENVEDEMVFEDQSMEEEEAVSMAPTISYKKNEDGETIVILNADYHEEKVVVAAEYTVENVALTSHFIPQIHYILLSKNSKFGIMNSKREIITSVTHDRIEWDHPQRGIAFLHKGDKVGLANYSGVQIFPTVFSSISRSKVNWHYFTVTHPDGYAGYANAKGEVFLPDYVDLKEE